MAWTQRFKRFGKNDLESARLTIKFFEHLLRASADGIVITDSTKNIIVANEAFCAIFGERLRSVAETNLFVWLEKLQGDAPQRWADLEKRVYSQGACHDVEFELHTETDTKWFSVNASLLKRVAAEETGVIVSIWRNISGRKLNEAELARYRHHLEELVKQRTAALQREVHERRQAQEALRESEETARVLLDATTDSAFLLKPDGTIITLNDVTAQRLGRHAADLVGKCSYDFLPPKLAESRRRRIEQVTQTGESDRFLDERAGIFFDHSIYPVLESQGKVSRIAIYSRDITKAKQAEEALRASEQKYRSILDSMKDAVYICSPGLRIKYMNPRMISRIGRDATGEHCYQAIYDRDSQCPWCIFDRIREGEHVEYELADPRDGCQYFIRNSPILNADGSISKLSIFHDITESKAMEAQLRQVHKMESIGTLTGGIAHDFNNLLYRITGNAELALEDVPEWNPVHANLKEIKTAGLNAAGIVKQLLNFSQKGGYELKPLGAVSVIKDALKFLSSTIPSTIEIRKHLPDINVSVLSDPILINQILMNICTNASQAMEDTGGILEIAVENVSIAEEVIDKYPDLTVGDHVKITVSDTGTGIDPEIIGRIFDPYFTTNEVGKGSGMGLAVVLGIVKEHSGAITVDSELRKGATFTVLLPVVAQKSEMESKIRDDIPRGNETILLVEDERSIAQMAGQMLERLGYRVETRQNPIEALELFQSKPQKFDLVITDMTMPKMTGVKLSEELKGVRANIPVILCTGHSSLINKEKAERLGIAAYVMKPIMKEDIAKSIRKVLDASEGSKKG